MKDCPRKPPSRWEFFKARLARYSSQRHNLWLRATLRCPGCRSRRPKHRFGCSRRPGKGLRISVYREP
jgi:hypothetical protein